MMNVLQKSCTQNRNSLDHCSKQHGSIKLSATMRTASYSRRNISTNNASYINVRSPKIGHL